MGDELRCFPRKDEVLAGLLLPAFHGFYGRSSVEHTIQFSAFELAGVVLKLRLYGKTSGIEGSSPRIIMPPGCAN